jgi:hypothetical protein
MLAHECLHARAFATLDRRNNEMMLTVRVQQHVVHPIQARPVESERLRTHKGNAGVALEGLLDHWTACFADDQIVKARIHVSVTRLVALFDVSFAEDPVAVAQADAQGVAKCSGDPAFHHSTRRQSFDHTAQVDGVDYVGSADLLYDVTTRLVFDQKTFLREDWQRLPHGRARHPEPLSEWRFGDALACAEFALQDHFTYAYQSPRLLSIHLRNDAGLLGGGAYRSGAYRRAYDSARILVLQCKALASAALRYPILAIWDPIGISPWPGALRAEARSFALWSALRAKSAG